MSQKSGEGGGKPPSSGVLFTIANGAYPTYEKREKRNKHTKDEGLRSMATLKLESESKIAQLEMKRQV